MLSPCWMKCNRQAKSHPLNSTKKEWRAAATNPSLQSWSPLFVAAKPSRPKPKQATRRPPSRSLQQLSFRSLESTLMSKTRFQHPSIPRRKLPLACSMNMPSSTAASRCTPMTVAGAQTTPPHSRWKWPTVAKLPPAVDPQKKRPKNKPLKNSWVCCNSNPNTRIRLVSQTDFFF